MATKRIIKEGKYIPIDNKKRLVNCARCGTLYEYEKGKPDNTYVDYDGFNHYDCPICGLEYYPIYWWFYPIYKLYYRFKLWQQRNL